MKRTLALVLLLSCSTTPVYAYRVEPTAYWKGNVEVPIALPPIAELQIVVPEQDLQILKLAQTTFTEDTKQDLLQTWIAEADLERRIDHLGITWVLLRRWYSLRMNGSTQSFQDYMHKYVSAFKVHVQGQPRIQWVRQVTLQCDRPAGFPGNENWNDPDRPGKKTRKELCLEAVDHINALFFGQLADPFHGHAQQWGMRSGIDLARALRAGWKDISHGRTANAFWQ